jgi:hypothetical protein
MDGSLLDDEADEDRSDSTASRVKTQTRLYLTRRDEERAVRVRVFHVALSADIVRRD